MMTQETKMKVHYIAKKCYMLDRKTEAQIVAEHTGAWFMIAERSLPDSHYKLFNFTPLQAFGEIEHYFDPYEKVVALIYFKQLCVRAVKEMGITSEDLREDLQ